MALANNDLLIVQKPATKLHYKIKVGDLPAGSLPDGENAGDYLEWDGTDWIPSAGPLPDGVNVGDYLEWDGTDWIPSSVIDGGTY